MHDPPPKADVQGVLDDWDGGPEPALERSSLKRTLRTVVVTVLLSLLVLGVVVLVSVLSKDVRTERGTIDLGGAPQLALRVPHADLRLVEGDVEAPTYEARVTRGILDTELALRRRDDLVHVVSDCRAWLNPDCGVELTVTVPRGVPVDVIGGSADVEADGLTGGVLTVRSDAGDVDADRLDVQELTVESDSGDVDASFVTQPFAVKVTTDSGDVELALPEGERPYGVDARSRSGEVENGFDVNGAGGDARLVLVRSDSGDVEIDRAG